MQCMAVALFLIILLLDTRLFSLQLALFYEAKWHVLRFISMPTEKKIISLSICDPIMLRIWQVKKSTIENMVLYFSHH